MKRISAVLASTVTSAVLTAGLTVGVAPAGPAYAADTDGIRDGQLNRLTERIHDRGAIGVTAELVTPDGTWTGSAGDARLQPREDAADDAKFRAGSVSKQLVSVLALQQVQSGRWSLDTTLGEVLPQLWPEQSGVTLRQLLSHTSGLPDFLAPLLGTDPSTAAFKAVISQRRTDAELVAAARTQPSTPAGEFSYANVNYVVVGLMLEQATGQRMARLVRERIFGPAAMTESSWPTGKRISGDRLQEYGRLYGQVEDLSSFSPTMFSSAGNLVTTARDLDRFRLALSRGELISQPLVQTMRTPVSDGGALGVEYGLGSYRLPDPCLPGQYVHGHDGGTWGTLTLSYGSPDGERRVTVAMTGRDYDGDIRSVQTLNRLAMVALAQTCGGTPTRDDVPATVG